MVVGSNHVAVTYKIGLDNVRHLSFCLFDHMRKITKKTSLPLEKVVHDISSGIQLPSFNLHVKKMSGKKMSDIFLRRYCDNLLLINP